MLGGVSGGGSPDALVTSIDAIKAGALHARTLVAALLRSSCLACGGASAVFLLKKNHAPDFILSAFDGGGHLSSRPVSLSETSLAYRAFCKSSPVVTDDVPHEPGARRVPRSVAAFAVRAAGVRWGVLELFDGVFSAEAVRRVEKLCAASGEALVQCRDSGALDAFPAVASDASTADLLGVLSSLSETEAPVLLLGEEGTGRHFFARHLHSSGSSCMRPFVRLSCADVRPAELEEAFLSCAEGGTLFLDGVPGLSPELQDTLLSLVRSAPGKRRIVSSSGEPLEALVDSGSFSADLYHRLSVMPVNVPPLRQRPLDTVALAARMLETECRRLGRAVPRISEGASEALRRLPLERNLHSLRAVMVRASLCCGVDEVAPQDVEDAGFSVHDGSLRGAVTEFKRRHVQAVLSRTGGNQTEAARILGVQRTYVSKLISELNLR